MTYANFIFINSITLRLIQFLWNCQQIGWRWIDSAGRTIIKSQSFHHSRSRMDANRWKSVSGRTNIAKIQILSSYVGVFQQMLRNNSGIQIWQPKSDNRLRPQGNQGVVQQWGIRRTSRWIFLPHPDVREEIGCGLCWWSVAETFPSEAHATKETRYGSANTAWGWRNGEILSEESQRTTRWYRDAECLRCFCFECNVDHFSWRTVSTILHLPSSCTHEPLFLSDLSWMSPDYCIYWRWFTRTSES